MNSRYLMCFFVLGLITLSACNKDEETPSPAPTDGPKLIFKFAFDEEQERLDNFGNPAVLPSGHAAQTPVFNSISANYIELIPNALTWLGEGEVVYVGEETTAGGDLAIDIDQAKIVAEGETFFAIPLAQVAAGTYSFIRVSLSYQNFDIGFRASGLDLTGTLASFIGYNNYITDFVINTQRQTVNANTLQGYWAFETLGQVLSGQAPAGATTVVNPLWDTAPVPAGSCVVTGAFASPFEISGNETEDVVVTLSVSVNNSFEWQEVTADGFYEPQAGEQVVDMGVRGLIPVVE
jgi:hypothetical protein